MATYQDVLDFVEEVAHRNPNDTGHVAQAKRALQRAIARWSSFTDWWFLEVELKLTLVAGQRIYSLPTSDIQGNEVTIRSVNKKSFRTKSIYQLAWWSPEDVEQYDPDWTDQENTSDPTAIDTATPYAVVQVGDQLALYPTPNADFLTDNPSLYFRGYKQMARPSDAEGATVTYDSEIQDVHSDYHHILDELTLAWVYRQARSDRWREAWQMSEGLLREMRDTSSFGTGLVANKIPPARQWRGGRMGGLRGFGRSDYGARIGG